ncbi:MAG TPA: nitronate monooxygenase [Candidatus Acidoferrales bacterium]|nr:nitronate monooxygenase [Candidatus Acidoferrales bacterium]
MTEKPISSPRSRAESFAQRLGLSLPIFLAPMSGACPPSLSAAVANAGGFGACGALLMQPGEIAAWCADFRRESQHRDNFQINLWIPDPPPARNVANENYLREFLAQWGPALAPDAGNPSLPDFDEQCRALLDAAPRVISSIMGLYPPAFVSQMKSRGILWFATATTVAEAKAAEAAGADAIVAEGMEAGGHRGAFRAEDAERQLVGSISLIPQIADAVSVPVIAAGGIADARAIAAALILGASAVNIGTGFLRAPEAKIHPAYAARLAQTDAHETAITRYFSGRPGRAAVNDYVRATFAPGAPLPAPYPVQRGLTRVMREAALKSSNVEHMQMWAGQSARLAQAVPAAALTQQLWAAASRLLP